MAKNKPKQSHKAKLRLARQMRTRKETAENSPPFQGKAWEQRKEARAKKQDHAE